MRCIIMMIFVTVTNPTISNPGTICLLLEQISRRTQDLFLYELTNSKLGNELLKNFNQFQQEFQSLLHSFPPHIILLAFRQKSIFYPVQKSTFELCAYFNLGAINLLESSLALSSSLSMWLGPLTFFRSTNFLIVHRPSAQSTFNVRRLRKCAYIWPHFTRIIIRR